MTKPSICILLLLLIGGCTSRYSVVKPEVFVFGESFDSIKEAISSECETIEYRNIIPITAPLAKESQKQIDCTGFIYAGKPRKIELVFQDDQLDLVWILLPSEEKSIVSKNLTDVYGDPSMIIEFGTIFLQANLAVRNNPSEVLFASKRQVEVMLNNLKQKE